MPIKRRVGKERQESASEPAWAFMMDEARPEDVNPFAWMWWEGELVHGQRVVTATPDMRELWAANKAAALADWTAEAPGTRPRCWWAWDAPRQPTGLYPGCWWDGRLPELRQRCGGIGTLRSDVLAYKPTHHLGVPTGWITRSDVAAYSGVHDFRGFPVSATDPPRFEAQATYLDRHGLLLPGEQKRLTSDDFLPELVVCP